MEAKSQSLGDDSPTVRVWSSPAAKSARPTKRDRLRRQRCGLVADVCNCADQLQRRGDGIQDGAREGIPDERAEPGPHPRGVTRDRQIDHDVALQIGQQRQCQ
jgi:hypothetical protein